MNLKKNKHYRAGLMYAMHLSGLSHRQIGRLVGLDHSNVGRWINRLSDARKTEIREVLNRGEE